MPQVPQRGMNNGCSFLSTSAGNKSHGMFVPILGHRGPHASEPFFADRVKQVDETKASTSFFA
eukprot:5147933-Heterocapsa_arctica.AAC.1